MAAYRAQYRSLVRLAVLLTGDAAVAEQVVQDSFVAMHLAWRRLADRGGDRDQVGHYLLRSVLVRSRSIRGGPTADLAASGRGPQVPGAGPAASRQQASARPARVLTEASAQTARSAVISALRRLPARQREALVLRFYLDLPAGQAASAMGISLAAVARHTARGLAALPGPPAGTGQQGPGRPGQPGAA
jgi:DNA-directed RNA polymerase specialized sigma24 family protein